MTKADSAQALVDSVLTQMLGLPIWEPSVGNGSFLTIEFGGPRITSEGVTHGQFHLWVYGASWRIRDQTRTIASSEDNRARMLAGAQVLDGVSMHHFQFDRRALSLELLLGQFHLSISALGDPDMEEWMLFLDDGNVITAGPGNSVVREPAGK